MVVRRACSGRLSAGILFSLSGLLVGCGDDRPTTPGGPTPVVTAHSNRAPRTSGSIPDQAVSLGEEARLDVQSYFSDPDGDTLTFGASSGAPRVATVVVSGSTLTLAPSNPGSTDVRVTASDPDGLNATQFFHLTVEPPAGHTGLDAVFWRQFAFNDHECRTPAGCSAAGYDYTPIEDRVLWRLPSPSPNFFLLTTRMDRALVDLVRKTIPSAVSQLTGVQYSGSIQVGTQDLRSRSGWIVVEGAGGGLQPEAGACRKHRARGLRTSVHRQGARMHRPEHPSAARLSDSLADHARDWPCSGLLPHDEPIRHHASQWARGAEWRVLVARAAPRCVRVYPASRRPLPRNRRADVRTRAAACGAAAG